MAQSSLRSGVDEELTGKVPTSRSAINDAQRAVLKNCQYGPVPGGVTEKAAQNRAATRAVSNDSDFVAAAMLKNAFFQRRSNSIE